MNSDFEELLKIFNGNEVKYLVVGGYAVMLYTEPRYTKDLDVWFGAPLAGLGPGDFAHKGFFYQNGQPPGGAGTLPAAGSQPACRHSRRYGQAARVAAAAKVAAPQHGLE